MQDTSQTTRPRTGVTFGSDQDRSITDLIVNNHLELLVKLKSENINFAVANLPSHHIWEQCPVEYRCL